MSSGVNYTYPFIIPQGPDFHDTYFVGDVVAVSWALPFNVSISLDYTNDTDEGYLHPSYTWTLLRAFPCICSFLSPRPQIHPSIITLQ